MALPQPPPGLVELSSPWTSSWQSGDNIFSSDLKQRSYAPWLVGPAVDEPIKVNLQPGMPPRGLDQGFPQKVFLPTETEGALSDFFSPKMDKNIYGFEEIWSHQAGLWNANATSWFETGTVVLFQGLRVAQELNGQCGVVDGWDAQSSRWSILMSDGETKFAKSENLRAVSIPSPTTSLDATAAAPGAGAFNLEALAAPVGTRSRRSKQRTSAVSSASSEPTTAPGSESQSLRSSFCSAEDAVEANALESPSPPTTVMMRNIPSEYTGNMLLTLLDTNDFKSCYDLVYLPMDYHNKVGFGYAFINFVSAEEAERFREAFEGFKEWVVVSEKVCEVCWSSVLQGVDAHIERYRNSPVMHPTVPDAFKPMLFKNGDRVAFPAPTKTIRPPRLRKKGQQA
eukprot:gb/GFBE01067967.1/.p1 GENE.gb/GFBE01067967.1/~~gb/GFBE01067967.1/.p1  ORF type:complete len:397 (+),score=77.92 gb/GFBE01067967.1/:1-1191(+)